MAKWFLGLGLCLLGCSGSSAGGSTGGAGFGGVAAVGGSSAGTAGLGASAGGASGGAASAGTSGVSGGASGASGDAFTSTLVSAPNQLRGDLGFQQYSTDNVNFGINVYMTFQELRGAWDGCTRQQLGACWYYDCPAGSNPPGNRENVSSVYYDAGTATITSMQPTISVGSNSGGEGYFVRNSQELWPIAGGVVSVSFSGGPMVPAFATQVNAPPMVRLTSINGQAAPASLKRSEGVKLAWTSAGAGDALLVLVQYADTPRPAVECRFDATANAGELPAVVLEKLDPGAGYTLEFRGNAWVDSTVGPWAMQAYALSYGIDFGANKMQVELQ